MKSSLETSDAECAVHAVAPRVSLEDIHAAIEEKLYVRGDDFADLALHRDGVVSGVSRDIHLANFPTLKVLTICVVVMKNGFTIIGKSAPAAPENYDGKLGRKLAYEDAVRQIWPLMGYALRDKLHAEEECGK